LQRQCTLAGCSSAPIAIDASAQLDASPEPGTIDYTVRCVGDAGAVDASLAEDTCGIVGPVAMCILPSDLRPWPGDAKA
jgi:hypothetical protein